MNSYDMKEVVSILGYFHNEFKKINTLLTKYGQVDYGQKTSIQEQIKQQVKILKDELKKQIKVLIEFNSNILVADYLLPPLCVAHLLLQDIGINRINPNSMNKVSQLTKKANGFITKFYNQLVNE